MTACKFDLQQQSFETNSIPKHIDLDKLREDLRNHDSNCKHGGFRQEGKISSVDLF